MAFRFVQTKKCYLNRDVNIGTTSSLPDTLCFPYCYSHLSGSTAHSCSPLRRGRKTCVRQRTTELPDSPKLLAKYIINRTHHRILIYTTSQSFKKISIKEAGQKVLDTFRKFLINHDKKLNYCLFVRHHTRWHKFILFYCVSTFNFSSSTKLYQIFDETRRRLHYVPISFQLVETLQSC